MLLQGRRKIQRFEGVNIYEYSKGAVGQPEDDLETVQK